MLALNIVISLKNSIFWDIKPYSPLKIKRRFCGIYYLLLQGLVLSEETNKYETGSKVTLKLRRNIPPKRRLTFRGLYGVSSHKREHNHRCEKFSSKKIIFDYKTPWIIVAQRIIFFDLENLGLI
jgi:hypothetical protein